MVEKNRETELAKVQVSQREKGENWLAVLFGGKEEKSQACRVVPRVEWDQRRKIIFPKNRVDKMKGGKELWTRVRGEGQGDWCPPSLNSTPGEWRQASIKLQGTEGRKNP